MVNNSEIDTLMQLLSRRIQNVQVLQNLRSGSPNALAKLIENSLNCRNQREGLLLPELRKNGNQTLGIFSDYGGEHSDSKFASYSFLILGWNHNRWSDDMFEEYREMHKFNGSTEMAHKGLKDGRKSRALSGFLHQWDWMPGMLFTLIVDKQIKSLFCGEEHIETMSRDLEISGFGKLSPKISEKQMRVTHTAAYLTALLAAKGQNLFWFSDNDAIMHNQDQSGKTVQLFAGLAQEYSGLEFGNVGWATPRDNDSSFLRDILSVTDITAGALTEKLNSNVVPAKKTEVKATTQKVLDWLSHDSFLKKHTMMVLRDPDGSVYQKEIRPVDQRADVNAMTFKI